MPQTIGEMRIPGAQATSLHMRPPPTATDYFYRYYQGLEACHPTDRLNRLEGMVLALQAGFTLDSVRRDVPLAAHIGWMLAEIRVAVSLTGRNPLITYTFGL